jgi:hypothetical protein
MSGGEQDSLEFIRFGKHSLWFEEPGVAVIAYRGDVDAEEMRVLCNIPDQERHQGRFQLTLCDMRQLGTVSPEARKIGAQRARPAAVYYTAYVGVSFAMRVVVSMWTRGTNFLQGPKNQVGFFDDMDAGRAWLRECYRRHMSAAQ